MDFGVLVDGFADLGEGVELEDFGSEEVLVWRLVFFFFVHEGGVEDAYGDDEGI